MTAAPSLAQVLTMAPPSSAAASRIWGMDLRAAHDRYWASKGVQVVRLGRTKVEERGPLLYLLVEEPDLLFLDLSRAVRELNWLKPRALRLRVTDRHADPYVETVVADASGRLIAVRREYRARTRSTRRALLTPEPGLAKVWAGAQTFRDAWTAIRDIAGRRRIHPVALEGRALDADEPDAAAEAGELLLASWKNPGGLLDGVYQYDEGIWLHESATIPPGVRLVAPVWIGAGVTLRPGDAVIGPAVVPDDPGASLAPAPVAWNEVRLWNGRALPRFRRGRMRRVSKRLFDIVFSLTVILFTLPLYPIIMLAIYLEDGWPPFFAHRRQTLGGREFPCWKFRTMCRNAEGLKEKLVAANICDGPQFFIKNDPRLLRVGHFLRRYQLDELPQFWNVLLGHMSVVGPRPSPDKENQYCPVWREARLSVRPGITGLWQVRRTREPETDFQEWIRYDLEYVQHESWRLDLAIIFKTIRRVLGG